MIKRLTKVRLPDEYQRVEYLESSGTQWIGTGITQNSVNTKIYCKFSYSKKSPGYIYGANTGLNCGYNSNQTVDTLRVSGVISNISIVLDEIYEVENYIIDGYRYFAVNKGSVSQAAKTTIVENEIMLFRMSGQTGTIPIPESRIFDFKIFEGDNIVLYYVPSVRKSDNKPGMYDLVSGQFFTNQGTGEFIVGEDINDPIEVWHTVKSVKRIVGGTMKDIHTIKRVVGGEVKTITI